MPILKLPDGSRREVAVGARSRDVAESIGKRLAKDAVAAKVDGCRSRKPRRPTGSTPKGPVSDASRSEGERVQAANSVDDRWK
jgi:hypothetical protein